MKPKGGFKFQEKYSAQEAGVKARKDRHVAKSSHGKYKTVADLLARKASR